MKDDGKERQQYALQTIFSFFLGLMVLAFIGIGVNTFYPQPEYQENPEQEALQKQQDLIYREVGKNDDGELTAAQQARVDELQEQIDALWKEEEQVRENWARNTSIILILFATAVMGISLIQSAQLRVISNGLLLGGLFTMVYGVGYVLFSGESIARFAVIVFALAVTVALGYLKFVRGREAAARVMAQASGAGGEADVAALGSLVARIETLEARTNAAAEALGSARHE
ncbi:MAG: hypothetical protein RBS78_03605 [Coriobacteriia bacterium]|jgi:hypothetical protein|nr:hypothetical protein [Coriobacteriia bacterium]